MNRTYLIAAAALGVVIAGLVLYVFVFSPRTPSVQVTQQGSTTLPQVSQTSAGSFATTTLSTVPAAPTQVSSRLVKISAGPVVPGEVVVDSAASASSSPSVTVDYIERQSGNVYAYQVGGASTRTSNRTIPGIQSATWMPDGSMALVRYLSGNDLSTINTYALPANGAGGFFLAQNLAGAAVSSSTVLALASGVNGSTITTERPDGSHSATAFATPLSQISAQFAGKRFLVVTKSSGTISGAAFLTDSAGSLSRIAGPASGLTALGSPSGKWVLAGMSNAGTLHMELIDTTTGTATPLPIATLADKCVWSADETSIYCAVPSAPDPNATYPDDWYQGAAHFSDRLWRIDTLGHYVQLVVDLSAAAGTPIDAEALAIDKNRSALVFVNKTDGSLWSYSL